MDNRTDVPGICELENPITRPSDVPRPRGVGFTSVPSSSTVGRLGCSQRTVVPRWTWSRALDILQTVLAPVRARWTDATHTSWQSSGKPAGRTAVVARLAQTLRSPRVLVVVAMMIVAVGTTLVSTLPRSVATSRVVPGRRERRNGRATRAVHVNGAASLVVVVH